MNHVQYQSKQQLIQASFIFAPKNNFNPMPSRRFCEVNILGCTSDWSVQDIKSASPCQRPEWSLGHGGIPCIGTDVTEGNPLDFNFDDNLSSLVVYFSAIASAVLEPIVLRLMVVGPWPETVHCEEHNVVLDVKGLSPESLVEAANVCHYLAPTPSDIIELKHLRVHRTSARAKL